MHANVVKSKDSITRTDPVISKLVDSVIPDGYHHVDADIQKDRGVQDILKILFEMIKSHPVKINYETEFYVVQIPDLLKDETDVVKNICMFMHLRYFMKESFRNEVNYLRDSKRQVNKINGSFPSSEIIDGCMRYYDDDIQSSPIEFVYFQ